MNAAIVTIGDELLIGQVVNTNAAWLGENLGLLGINVIEVLTVGDDEPAIVSALKRATDIGDIVVVSGGLGPTHDDITREAIASFLNVALVLDEEVLAAIQRRFQRRRVAMPERNKVQAMVPEGFEVLPNRMGTAPGLYHASSNSGTKDTQIFVLPGVPRELKTLFAEAIQPILQLQTGVTQIVHRTILTAGIGESNQAIGDVSSFLDGTLRLAYLPGTSGVRLRLTSIGLEKESIERRIVQFEAVLEERIGQYIFGYGQDKLAAVIGGILNERGMSIATSESCSGGLIAHRLTNIAGSSAYMVGGVVAYANQVKVNQLGVDVAELEEYGAVSEPVATQMAQGVRKLFDVDIGISTTGIAGPTGGSEDKPVGTVWIGYSDKDHAFARRFTFVQDREVNKELFSTAALNLLRLQLLGIKDA